MAEEKKALSPKKFISDSPKLNFFVGLILGIAVISSIGFAGLSMGRNNQDKNVAADNSKVAGEETQPEINLAIAENDRVLGNKDAAVKIFEFSDFQCPYCSVFQETMNQVIKEYGDKVAWVFKHFPIGSHPLAAAAALSAECAGDQGKFWEFSDEIYANQTGLKAESFEKFATDLKLDMEKYNTCVAEEKFKDKINADYNLGIQSGVNGTPTSFINNQAVPGAVPFADLKGMIDSLLK
jgi:protein-disulfide isomerase